MRAMFSIVSLLVVLAIVSSVPSVFLSSPIGSMP
jgi:hypothetical protein